MLKRWIALALSLVLMLSALPLGVFAETEPTETTQPAQTEGTTPAETTDSVTSADPEEEKKEDAEEPKKLEITATPVAAWGTATPPQQLRTKAARIQLLRNAIAWDYQNALFQEKSESLLGYCGVLASYQMYYRGINTWRKSADGKNHFDEYSTMSMTTGGYIPQAYAAQEQVEEQPQEQEQEETQEQEKPKGKTLEQTLNEITNRGTHDVYNLLVCFEKTSTEAGSQYGHVVFIYGIIDGILYFTESGNGFGKEAGQSMECTISQFAASYDTWAEFEGIVVLGCKDYLENCAAYQSDLFASCITPVQLLALPYQEDSQLLRTVQKGERLHVIGLYENREKQYYYQIDDGGEIGYVQAEAMLPILYLHDTFELTELKAPQSLRPGKDFSLDGSIKAPGALLSQICIQILDEEGKCLQKVVREASGEEYDLGNYQLNAELNFAVLEEGSYTCRIQADSLICAYTGGTVVSQIHTETLLEQSFTVEQEEKTQETPASAEAPAQEQPAETVAATEVLAEEQAEEPVKNGWYYENQTWYCYKQGVPCSGWILSAGVAYYLKEDGSVTTGWATVDGKQRLFTATGAMFTGWLKEQDVTKYLDKNGLPVTGWHRIDGAYYYFDDQGILQSKYAGSALRQLRQMGLSIADIKNANKNQNSAPQEE